MENISDIDINVDENLVGSQKNFIYYFLYNIDIDGNIMSLYKSKGIEIVGCKM